MSYALLGTNIKLEHSKTMPDNDPHKTCLLSCVLRLEGWTVSLCKPEHCSHFSQIHFPTSLQLRCHVSWMRCGQTSSYEWSDIEKSVELLGASDGCHTSQQGQRYLLWNWTCQMRIYQLSHRLAAPYWELSSI